MSANSAAGSVALRSIMLVTDKIRLWWSIKSSKLRSTRYNACIARNHGTLAFEWTVRRCNWINGDPENGACEKRIRADSARMIVAYVQFDRMRTRAPRNFANLVSRWNHAFIMLLRLIVDLNCAGNCVRFHVLLKLTTHVEWFSRYFRIRGIARILCKRLKLNHRKEIHDSCK